MTQAAFRLQRSRGQASIGLSGGRITALGQSGSAKVFVHPAADGARDIVFLNTSGGLASGDVLGTGITLDGPIRARATTQTAERAYRSEGPPAQVTVDMTLAGGAALDWLPQETILFEGAALDRLTRVELDATAAFLGIETIVLGRAAMGETVSRLHLTDRREIRRNGRLLAVDCLRLSDAGLAADGPALRGGARVLATLMLAQADAADWLVPVRAHLDVPDIQAAASARPGLLVLRLLAADGWTARQAMVRLIACLRPGGVPRVWQ